MTYNMIRRAKFVDDVAKRDGFPTMDAYRYHRWGKALCTYYVNAGADHPRWHLAKMALEYGRNN
jgi:hypothetical protein